MEFKSKKSSNMKQAPRIETIAPDFLAGLSTFQFN